MYSDQLCIDDYFDKGKVPEPFTSGVKYSRDTYWKPNLNKAEWSLLDYALDKELETSDNYIDKATKWLYAEEKNTRVFAFYGIGDGTEATVLYAVGGNKADIAHNNIEAIAGGKENGVNRTAGTFRSWIDNLRRGKNGTSNNAHRVSGRKSTVGNGRVSGNSGGQSSTANGNNVKGQGNSSGITYSRDLLLCPCASRYRRGREAAQALHGHI